MSADLSRSWQWLKTGADHSACPENACCKEIRKYLLDAESDVKAVAEEQRFRNTSADRPIRMDLKGIVIDFIIQSPSTMKTVQQSRAFEHLEKGLVAEIMEAYGSPWQHISLSHSIWSYQLKIDIDWVHCTGTYHKLFVWSKILDSGCVACIKYW